MKADKVAEAVAVILGEELPQHSAAAKNLQEALGYTSLEVVSLQMSVEEVFGLKFGTGVADRTSIDDEWDALTSVDGLVGLIVKYTEK